MLLYKSRHPPQSYWNVVSKFIPQGMGWIPDLPDPRDYTYRHPEILPLLRQLKPPNRQQLADELDLRKGEAGELFLTEVDDQGPLNSSAAFATLSLVEYFERRMYGRTFEGSRRFLYKVARNLRIKSSRITGDTGTDLRTTLKAIRQFGIPDEAYCPYDIDQFDHEPGPFAYQVARSLRHYRYFRIESDWGAEQDSSSRWEVITSFLSAGFPMVFGFSVPSSLSTAADITFRPELDAIGGGQCALAVGYKLNYYGRSQHALLIRSSWGTSWGTDGYGWLPHSYVQHQLAADFWTMLQEDWINAGELSCPSVLANGDECQ